MGFYPMEAPMTLTIALDEGTETALRDLCQSEGAGIDDLASRLLKRAVRAARPRYDIEALKARYAEFADEDLALADSDLAHRAELLDAEDRL